MQSKFEFEYKTKQGYQIIGMTKLAFVSCCCFVFYWYFGTFFLVYLFELIALFSYNFRIAAAACCCQFQSQLCLPQLHWRAGTPVQLYTCRPSNQCPTGPQMPPSGTTWPQSSTPAPAPAQIRIRRSTIASVSFT